MVNNFGRNFSKIIRDFIYNIVAKIDIKFLEKKNTVI